MRRRIVRTHSSEEFEEHVVPLLDALYRAARTWTGNEQEAADLVQSTCVKALERFTSFEPGSCRAWMMRIMRNIWIDQLRHRRVAGKVVSIEEELEAPVASAEISGTELKEMLEQFSDAEVIRTLRELPEIQRMALFLTDVEELSQEEVAEVLDVAVGTVKSRVSRARAVLRHKLEGYAREMGFLERRSCRTEHPKKSSG